MRMAEQNHIRRRKLPRPQSRLQIPLRPEHERRKPGPDARREHRIGEHPHPEKIHEHGGVPKTAPRDRIVHPRPGAQAVPPAPAVSRVRRKSSAAAFSTVAWTGRCDECSVRNHSERTTATLQPKMILIVRGLHSCISLILARTERIGPVHQHTPAARLRSANAIQHS